MATCEFCKKPIDDSSVFVYEMTSGNGAVTSYELCPDCASDVACAVRKVRENNKPVSGDHLYDDVPGEVL